MRSAVAQLALWALQEQHFERIELRIATGNVASQRVADSCGFVHEGVLRNAGSIHAGRVDLIVYSLIPGDLLEEPE
jgi:RimJ/RimL family protein N-acetyltransferase